MDMEEEQQPPPQPRHRGVLHAIARLEDPRCREERHKLEVNGRDYYAGRTPVDGCSLQNLVDFLDNHRDAH
jgi:hypothetical protein